MVQKATVPLSNRLFSTEKVPESLLPSKSTNLYIPLSARGGRVDILARQTGTGDKVVIENQLGSSDDSHCLRLLGYAANAEANTLVWVARDFSEYHQSILRWLNSSDTIGVYAVKVNAYLKGAPFPGSVFRSNPLSQKHRSTFLPLHNTDLTPPFGGFGLRLSLKRRLAWLSRERWSAGGSPTWTGGPAFSNSPPPGTLEKRAETSRLGAIRRTGRKLPPSDNI